jgi:hypothetical protein
MTFHIHTWKSEKIEHDGKIVQFDSQRQERDYMAKHGLTKTDNKEISQHNHHLGKGRDEVMAKKSKETLESIRDRIIYEARR